MNWVIKIFLRSSKTTITNFVCLVFSAIFQSIINSSSKLFHFQQQKSNKNAWIAKILFLKNLFKIFKSFFTKTLNWKFWEVIYLLFVLFLNISYAMNWNSFRQIRPNKSKGRGKIRKEENCWNKRDEPTTQSWSVSSIDFEAKQVSSRNKMKILV
jgi:hypothetical protein